MYGSEFNEEKLVCTEHEQQGKRYAYKFKYCGRAHGIVNLYVPAHVTTVFISIEEDIFSCKLTESIKYNTGQYKFVSSECFPINLLDIPSNKISVVIRSYAHFSNAPKIIAMCEYVRSQFNFGNFTDNLSTINDSKQGDDYYHNTTKYISSRSSPRDIISPLGTKQSQEPTSIIGSVPLSGINFATSPGSASKGISEVLRAMDK